MTADDSKVIAMYPLFEELPCPADVLMIKLEKCRQLIPIPGAVAAHFFDIIRPAFTDCKQMFGILPAEQRVDKFM